MKVRIHSQPNHLKWNESEPTKSGQRRTRITNLNATKHIPSSFVLRRDCTLAMTINYAKTSPQVILVRLKKKKTEILIACYFT